jgi:hypothetical protein
MGATKNAVAVVVVQHEDVNVPGVQRNNKFANLVSVDLAGGGLDNGGETVMCALVVGAIVGREVEHCFLVRVAEAGGGCAAGARFG